MESSALALWTKHKQTEKKIKMIFGHLGGIAERSSPLPPDLLLVPLDCQSLHLLVIRTRVKALILKNE